MFPILAPLAHYQGLVRKVAALMPGFNLTRAALGFYLSAQVTASLTKGTLQAALTNSAKEKNVM